MPIRLRIAIVVLLLHCNLMATTVVYVVAPEGIVIGADSKLVGTSLGGNMSEPLPGVRKIAVIQNRLVVASVGIDVAEVWGKKENRIVFSYNFQTWIARIEKTCPHDVSVSAVTQLIKSESEKTFKDAAQFFVNDPARLRGEDVGIEYLVAGYENRSPVVNYVHFKFDWNNMRLNGPIVERTYPGDKVLVFGKREITDSMGDPKSQPYKELLSVIPNELPKIVADQSLNRNEAVASCIAVLKYETKHNEATVGPPYIITVISPFGLSQKTY
jgi:hypothetical protein